MKLKLCINLVRSKKIVNNTALIYMISRYLNYAIQFVNSLLIAMSLGPFYLGVWGFIYLVVNYVTQLNFGIAHSVNVIASIEKENTEHIRKIVGNGITMLAGLSLVVLLFFLIAYFTHLPIGAKYNFYNYVLPVCFIAIITHFNSLLSNIFRVYGRIWEIIINQSLYPVLLLFVLIFVHSNNLLWIIIITHCFALLASLIIFIIKSPINLFPLFNFNLIKYIQNKALYLFMYNTSFYFILISTRSFISDNYSIKEFGLFTFAYQFASAIMLLLDSFSYLIFPKMINRFSNPNTEQVTQTIESIRKTYILSSHLLIHISIMLFPLFLYIFPQYAGSLNIFKITALTIVIYANVFPYATVLLARSKEKLIAIIALLALVINVILSYVLINVLSIPFKYSILSTFLTYAVYVYFVYKYSRKILHKQDSILNIIKDVFNYKTMLPLIISFIFILFNLSNIMFIIPFLLLLLLNIKGLINVKELVFKIINNPNIINI